MEYKMRDIKFRAWNGKKIIEPVISDGTDGGETAYVNMNQAIDCYDYELMQFTGLQDKNGNDIYEGDVVEVESYYRLGEFTQKVVKWEDNGGYNIFNITDKLIEVVGNIYENPELIKDGIQQ